MQQADDAVTGAQSHAGVETQTSGVPAGELEAVARENARQRPELAAGESGLAAAGRPAQRRLAVCGKRRRQVKVRSELLFLVATAKGQPNRRRAEMGLKDVEGLAKQRIEFKWAVQMLGQGRQHGQRGALGARTRA